MRLLLSSADPEQIARLAKILFMAGIRCEVRDALVGQETGKLANGGQLWLQQESDYYGAVMLFSGFPRPTA
jgi:hypothetical protein